MNFLGCRISVLMLCALLFNAAGMLTGLISYLVAPGETHAELLKVALILMIGIYNFFPVFYDICLKRLDFCEVNNIALMYFAVLFTIPCMLLLFDFTAVPFAMEVSHYVKGLREMALSIILLSLCSFNCGVLLSKRPHRFTRECLPIDSAQASRAYITGILCFLTGLIALIFTLADQGGPLEFASRLPEWRTHGVIAGAGHVLFPVGVIMPYGVLLIASCSFKQSPHKLSIWCWSISLLSIAAVIAMSALGFRILILLFIVSFVIVWHYRRRYLRGVELLLLVSIIIGTLVVFGVAREIKADTHENNLFLRSALYRVAGLQTVERVIQLSRETQSTRNLSHVLLESLTIAIPRSIWSGKPEPGNLQFAATFFEDYFRWRDGSAVGVMSGMPPTLPGEALWVTGLGGVIIVSLAIGFTAGRIYVWFKFKPNQWRTFVYAAVAPTIILFLEAPQNALNALVLSLIFIIGLYFFVIVKINSKHERKQYSLSSFDGTLKSQAKSST
jgi:oligosaccharide repeat unit polymerase